jgi:hypothetical protein
MTVITECISWLVNVTVIGEILSLRLQLGISFFWGVTPRDLVVGTRIFEATQCPHL